MKLHNEYLVMHLRQSGSLKVGPRDIDLTCMEGF